MTLGSLFAGIGGIDLGFERAGFTTKWQVEIDPYAQKVLAKHWPHVARFSDIRECGRHNLEPVDCIAGGFPCQDISTANVKSRVGLSGTKSGLWYEFLRIINELKPSTIVIENSWTSWRLWVPAVRRQLWEQGYWSLPLGIDSAVFGSHHRRRRAFVVANSNSDCQSTFTKHVEMAIMQESAIIRESDWGAATSRALGMADGVPNRSHRLRCLGNAVVPQVAEFFARRLIERLNHG